jgi:hypothetical protein
MRPGFAGPGAGFAEALEGTAAPSAWRRRADRTHPLAWLGDPRAPAFGGGRAPHAV